MTSRSPRPDPKVTPELTGYATEISLSPGDELAFMVSTTEVSYAPDMVKLIHGDEHPDGPGFRERAVSTVPASTHPGRVQETRCGSYARSSPTETVGAGDALTLIAWVQPTLPAVARSGILTWWSEADCLGFGVFREPEGDVSLRLGHGAGRISIYRTGVPLPVGVWSHIAASYDRSTETVCDRQTPRARESRQPTIAVATAAPPGASTALPVIIAAFGNGAHPPIGHFTGKIDRPAILSHALPPARLDELAYGKNATALAADGLLAAWDFSADPSTTEVADYSGHGVDLHTTNGPGRAVTGFNWSGEEIDHRRRPAEYGAIHFHEDDLDDARWEADFSWTVPPQTPSGVYAARLRGPNVEDHIPFVVRPRVFPTADILFVLPTFTYMAYANERLLTNRAALEALAGDVGVYALDDADRSLLRQPEWGIALTHTSMAPEACTRRVCVRSSTCDPNIGSGPPEAPSGFPPISISWTGSST